MNRTLMAAILGCALAVPAAADSVPEYFAGNAWYMRNLADCEPGNFSEARLEVTAKGLFGHELSCSFLDFRADTDKATGTAFAHVALANCGDDSGISRPDNFTIIYNEYDSTLRIQSQSEYVLGEMLAMTPRENADTTDPFEAASYLSGDYVLCPTP